MLFGLVDFIIIIVIIIIIIISLKHS